MPRYRESSMGKSVKNAKRCPHLKKVVSVMCRADETVYSPSAFQLLYYCSSRDHERCPFYLSVKRDSCEPAFV
jgi:hypothetical protein